MEINFNKHFTILYIIIGTLIKDVYKYLKIYKNMNFKKKMKMKTLMKINIFFL